MLHGLLPLRAFLDPRGRSDRRGLLVVTGVLLALQGGAAALVLLTGRVPHGPVAWLIEAAFLWLGIVATARRLHDCGHSAWWIAGVSLAVMVWCFVLTTSVVLFAGPAAFAQGSPWFTATLAAVMGPVLALLVWLHFEAGEGGDNAYGPPPTGSGFSGPLPEQRLEHGGRMMRGI